MYIYTLEKKHRLYIYISPQYPTPKELSFFFLLLFHFPARHTCQVGDNCFAYTGDLGSNGFPASGHLATGSILILVVGVVKDITGGEGLGTRES